jgi:hypothetical protein
MARLNIPAANAYNRGRSYSTTAIRIIQREVGAPLTGSFDDRTAQQIHAWQAVPARMSQLPQDGEMGPNALGTLIAELSRAGNAADALHLSAFPNVLPAGVAPPAGAAMMPIIEFRHIPVVSTGLHPLAGGGWTMGGVFRVKLILNQRVNCRQYEYRQFIRGTCTMQQGTFAPGAHTVAGWTATGPLVSMASTFHVPGGLSATDWHEDGFTSGSSTHRVGHRSNAGVNGPQREDRYLPTQATGWEYRVTDSFGLRGSTLPVGMRIRLHLEYEGRVIDRLQANRVIQTLRWNKIGDDIKS